MSYNTALRTSASALTAQRVRMDVISNNLANAETTRTPSGEPYRRQQVAFAAGSTGANSRFDAPLLQMLRGQGGASPLVGVPAPGVRVSAVLQDESPVRLVYQPEHPDANAEGYVGYPNVNVVTEMTDMVSATRSYEANVTALNAAKGMALKALEIGRG